ncbi:MAG: hypothetical protein QG657_3617, partial [Acidobacteriota bacterium]|nr:hypothetical protein [Acidobacteriota bacterium]
IMLIDFKDPEKPIYLKTITKFGERGFVDGVNAVGLTQICSGANRGKYLFVCGGSGGSELIFGISSGYDLRDPNLTINLFGIVTIPDSGNRIGETINLVRDRDGKIYFISFTNDDEVPNSGTDRAWLFDVVGGDGGITDVTRGRYVILDDLPSGDYGDVKAAACAYVSPSGRLILYSACHSDYCRGIIFVPTKDCREGYVKMGEFASK